VAKYLIILALTVKHAASMGSTKHAGVLPAIKDTSIFTAQKKRIITIVLLTAKKTKKRKNGFTASDPASFVKCYL